MNNGFIWWTRNKDKLGLIPALVFWVVSIFCFVFGLAFENPTGITIGSIDLSMVIAFGLGLANTIIQVVGNDTSKEDMGAVMWWGWLASYLFGIGSNVNFLLNTINLGVPILKIAVCVGLGSMIEILPERLFVRFLKSLSFVATRINRQESVNQRDERHEKLRVNYPPKTHLMNNKPKPNVPPFLMNRKER